MLFSYWVCVSVYACAHVEVKNNLQGLVFFFCYVDLVLGMELGH